MSGVLIGNLMLIAIMAVLIVFGLLGIYYDSQEKKKNGEDKKA